MMGWLRSLGPGPNADPKRRLDWEFMKIAGPGESDRQTNRQEGLAKHTCMSLDCLYVCVR